MAWRRSVVGVASWSAWRACLGAICVAAWVAAPVAARADGALPVVPVLLGQFDFQGHPSWAEGGNGFSLTRMRLGAYSQPAPWVFAIAMVDFADSDQKPQLKDAYAAVQPVDGLRLAVGYIKNPIFESARNEMDGTTPMPELSMPVAGLWPGRDLSFDVHYFPRRLPFEAWAHVGNGSESFLVNDNERLAYSVRLDAVAGRAHVGAPRSTPLGLRVGFGAHLDDTYDRDGVEGRIVNGYVFYQPPIVSGDRVILEAHALGYAGPVRALVEVGAAQESRLGDNSGNPSLPRPSLDPSVSRGGAAEVAWMVTGQHRLPGVWPVEGPAWPMSWQKVGVEVAARVERLDLARETRDVTAGGGTGGALAATVWIGPLLSLAVAGYVYHYDVSSIEEPGTTSSWLLQSRATFFLNPPPPVSYLEAPPPGDAPPSAPSQAR
jgi:phosphate-selective porin OprO/OprP